MRSVPGPQPDGKRGPKPKYGTEVVSLAKRAGHRQSWQEEEMVLYGVKVMKTYKTFLATWRPAGGEIRVVVVKEDDGWFAFFCTDPKATAAEILEMVADRNSLEQTFKDVKEVWGAGQQQVRNVYANIGAFAVNLTLYSVVEAWAWPRADEELVDRSDSPWDSSSRRPSHADKRRAWRRELLGEEIRAVLHPGVTEEEIQAAADRLLNLAA